MAAGSGSSLPGRPFPSGKIRGVAGSARASGEAARDRADDPGMGAPPVRAGLFGQGSLAGAERAVGGGLDLDRAGARNLSRLARIGANGRSAAQPAARRGVAEETGAAAGDGAAEDQRR